MNTHIYCQLAYPGCEPKQIETECSTLDLLPTIAALMGFDAELPRELQALLGTSLLPLLDGTEPEDPRTLRMTNRFHTQLRSRVVSLRRDGWRYQYMHPENMNLHEDQRRKGPKTLAPENLYRCLEDGLESPVNVENTRITHVIRDFRKARLEADLAIQRYWLRVLDRKERVPLVLIAMLESIDPNATDQQKQIRMSEGVDTKIRELVESTLRPQLGTRAKLPQHPTIL